MLSSLTGTDTTIEALQLGAEDFIEKPKDLNSDFTNFKSELELKIKSVSCVNIECDIFKKREYFTKSM